MSLVFSPLALLEGLVLYNVGYLALTTGAALIGRRRPRPLPPERHAAPRLGVLIPAHDEEAVIRPLIESLKAQAYPLDAIVVIADNCSDRTAEVARECGARVLERSTPEPSTKGLALSWGWRELGAPSWDAVIILDADNLVDPGFTVAISREFRRGFAVVQGVRQSKNPDATPASALDSLAEAIHHHLIAPGRDRLGLGGILSGSGVALRRDLFDRLLEGTTTMVEDCEWQLQLMADGIPIRWTPNAIVYDEKTADFGAMATQRSRWIQGKWTLFSRYLLPLLSDTLKGHRGAADGLLYLFTTLPRSYALLGVVAFGLLSLVGVPWVAPWGIWALALGLFGWHMAIGVQVAGGPTGARMLLYAPFFIGSMVLATIRAAGRRTGWAKTRHAHALSIADLPSSVAGDGHKDR